MEIRNSFKNRVISLSVQNKNENELDPKVFLNDNKAMMHEILHRKIKEHNSIKFNLELFAEYVKISGEEMLIELKSMAAEMKAVFLEVEINPILEEMFEVILFKMDEFQERDSGWALIRIKSVEININKYQPLSGSSYLSLPKKIVDKRAIVNIENKDEYCFKWAVISALHPEIETHVGRTSSYYQVSDISRDIIALDNIILDFTGLSFPLELPEIKTFESKNNISINVFGFSEGEKPQIEGPYYMTMQEKRIHINLLFHMKGEVTHFMWIKHISRLITSDVLDSSRRRLLFCNTCLQHFYNDHSFDKHKGECKKMVTKMPADDKKIIKLENYDKQMMVPFVTYADFECILKPVHTCLPDPSTSSTTILQEHVPCAFSYYMKCSFDENEDIMRTFIGENCASEFLHSLVEDTIDRFNKHLKSVTPMKPITSMQAFLFEKATMCTICAIKFNIGEVKVRDHCHLTGEYRGAAHNLCNLKFKMPTFFPILFHNLSGYDAHLFFKLLREIDGEIKVIPLNKEKYISFSKKIAIDEKRSIELRFLDSYRFLGDSIDSLARNLVPSDFIITRKCFETEQSLDLVKRKGVFPYEFLDSWQKMSEPCLPERVKFFNKLTNEECSTEDYQLAISIWNHFNCHNLKSYMEIYLKSDVVLLADIFENFRKVCRHRYSLDPCHYYTAPGLSWDAMFKVTKVELELLTDIEMYNFFQKGIRGGLTQCSHRYSRANNKFIESYDSEKPSSYLVYLDANNLYGWAMSQNLPCGDFEWQNPQNFSLAYIESLNDIYVGYVLEVDLEYPENLHDIHNGLPFCPENIATPGSKFKKLVASFLPKRNYVIHLESLKQALKHCLILKKVHRVIKFKQSKWLEQYISLNTELRKKAKTDFQKRFFKLMNLSIYGKTMENIEKRSDVKIVTRWENKRKSLGARGWIARPNFHSSLQFAHEDDEVTNPLLAIQMSRCNITLNKPIYLGFIVLELSKILMYEFHYDYIKPKYHENALLNYMDTDSFIYNIKSEDFYSDILDDIPLRFDTYDFDPNNQHNIPRLNNKVLGMFKDETCGSKMLEFVGLRARSLYKMLILSKKRKESKDLSPNGYE
ncbi:uncharacterized protein LOC129907698 [Episyrphus balteatus]|uniref:uncharacterized protein LOC129907698 n=1 Tax=Episyrphus balteatus TaxID=286459 RepID=UPI0024857503|nr:uncharacterized protein LOC129907698 [Episyrphus balteatus]